MDRRRIGEQTNRINIYLNKEKEKKATIAYHSRKNLEKNQSKKKSEIKICDALFSKSTKTLFLHTGVQGGNTIRKVLHGVNRVDVTVRRKKCDA